MSDRQIMIACFEQLDDDSNECFVSKIIKDNSHSGKLTEEALTVLRDAAGIMFIGMLIGSSL